MSAIGDQGQRSPLEFGGVAQSVERGTHNPSVVGATPTPATESAPRASSFENGHPTLSSGASTPGFDLEAECAKARQRINRGIGQRVRWAKAEIRRMADAARAEILTPGERHEG